MLNGSPGPATTMKNPSYAFYREKPGATPYLRRISLAILFPLAERCPVSSPLVPVVV